MSRSLLFLAVLLALSGVVDAKRMRGRSRSRARSRFRGKASRRHRSVAPPPVLSPETCWLSPWEDHPDTCFADLPLATAPAKELYHWSVAVAIYFVIFVVLFNMGKMQEWVRRSYLRLQRRVRFLDDINNNPVEEMSQNDMNNILGEEMTQGEINNQG